MADNNVAVALLSDSVWLDKYKFDDAERYFYESRAKTRSVPTDTNTSSLVDEIANARKRIQNSLKAANKLDLDKPCSVESQEIQKLRTEFVELKALVLSLQKQLTGVFDKVSKFEQIITNPTSFGGGDTQVNEKMVNNIGEDADDDDIDLFGSDEDESAAKLREERLKAYETKKAKKGPLVAKSSVVLDVKPWDDETDMKQMEVKVREITSDGLVWGASKLVPLAYGIQKLQIVAVVEDDKVSIDWLQETIQEIEDYVQSVDIAAFNKL